MKTYASGSRQGFALPMTILVVVSLLIMVIGLVAMLTLERKTARSYSHAARAEMALESGLNDAISTLTQIASRDDTLVFRLEDPQEPVRTTDGVERQQFFTYGSIFQNGNWRNIPLFSGLKEVSTTPATNKPNSPNTDTLLANLNTPLDADEIKDLGRLSEMDFNIPRAKWVELPQPQTTTVSNSDYKVRYAWWVEDLNGRLDGRTNGSEPRDQGLNTNELGIYTLFDSNSNTGGSGPADKLVDKRLSLRTPASTRLVISANDSKKIEPYLTYSPAPETNATIVEPAPVIPQGFGYADAGETAMDLNEAVASRDLQGITDQITRNLPDWNTNNRKGGFPAAEDYVKTLAASIIDYADTDSDATVGTGYRGVDSYPFVNELFDRYEWTNTAGGNVNIKVSTYVELWNLSQQTITGKVDFENENRHQISIPPSGVKLFTPISYSISNPITIPPNGFVVRLVGENTYQFTAGAFPPSQLSFTETTTSNFKLKWNGVTVDTARGKLQRTNGTLNAGTSARKWKGNSSPALDYSIGQSGDPRSSYYVNTWVYANNYDENTNWGGRCLKRSISNANYNEVKIGKWADRGSDSTAGIRASSDATLPTGLSFPANQPKMAPAFISNKGYYESVAELGNIFDPSQFTNVEQVASAPNANAGGGYTLAIGRPEYGRFDKPGLRSAQLLDLFRATPQNSGTVTNDKIGTRININTAPREVLRTLVAGVKIEDDQTLSTLYPAKASMVGDKFADAVINTRKYAPLRGPSDLALIRQDPLSSRNYTTPNENTDPFFGSRAVYGSSKPADTWNDRGREELFRKVLNLVSFQGKSFRIVVAGEAVDRNGNVLGRTTREIHILMEPERDSEGALVANGKMTIKKLYEKSL